MSYQPRKGGRIRVTRHRPNGQRHFVKTGTVLDVAAPTGSRSWPLYQFKDDSGPRVHLMPDETYAQQEPGWTQTIEPEYRGTAGRAR